MLLALMALMYMQQLCPYFLEGPTSLFEDAGIIACTYVNLYASISELDINCIMSGEELISSHQDIDQIVSRAISLGLGPAIFVIALPTGVIPNDQVDDICENTSRSKSWIFLFSNSNFY